MESLLAAQNIELQKRILTPAQEAERQDLRAKVPAGVLEKFDRLVGRGKKAVAIVRSGVCSECHLRLPGGTLAALAYTTEIHYCDNCGRFLYLPQDEPLGLTNGAPSVTTAASEAGGQEFSEAGARAWPLAPSALPHLQ